MEHILVIGHEPTICDYVQSALAQDGSYRVSRARSGNEALPVVERDRPNLAIIDAMPDGVFCRRMAFDNSTAEVTSVAVERCPGALDVVGGPAPGKFEWGHH